MSILAPNINAYLEERLYHWAEWYSCGNRFGVGYPPISITFWACYQIAKTTSRGQPAPLPSDPDAEEIQQWVERMVEHSRRLVEALYCHYFTLGTLRDKAQRIGLSHTQYRQDLEMAKVWLAGRLCGHLPAAKKEV